MQSFFHNTKRILNLLSKKELTFILLLSLLILITTIFETLSIGLIIPLVSFISDATFIENYPWIYNFLSNSSQILDFFLVSLSEKQRLILTTVIIFTCFFILRHIFFLVVSWKKEKFKYLIKTSFSNKMYSGYLNLPYSFHLKNNSSILVRNSVQEVEIFSNNIIQLITMFSDFILTFSLLSLLLFFETTITLYMIFFISFLSAIFLILTKNKVLKLAKDRQQNDRKSFFYAKQGLEGIKEINILGRQKEFSNQYLIKYSKLSQIVLLQNFINLLPRVWLEIFVFISLLVFLFFSYYQSDEISKLIPLIALYVGTAFRLLPSINRIVVSMNQLKLGVPAIKVLTDELGIFDTKNNISSSTTKVVKPVFNRSLQLKNIDFDYGNSKSIIKSVNIEIFKGSTIGIMGSSGSGKSTLIDILTGLLDPKKGQVLVDGVDISKNLISWKKQIGYVPQDIFLLDDTIKNNIAFGVEEKFIDDDLIKESLNKAGLKKFINELPHGILTTTGERGARLSGGQSQRIAIARALYNKPSILILDEATNSLDISNENKILDTIKTNLADITVIIVSHRTNTVKICDKVYTINNGILKELTL